MITLTTPAQINSVLGGNTLVSYNKLVLSNISHDPVNMKISAQITMTSTTSPEMTPLTGSMNVWAQPSQGVLDLEVRRLNFYRRVRLTAEEAAGVISIITTAQTAIEAGLIGLGVIAGVQAAGV